MGPGPDQTARDSSSALPGQFNGCDSGTGGPEALRPGGNPDLRLRALARETESLQSTADGDSQNLHE
jgi:hypothetical protein